MGVGRNWIIHTLRVVLAALMVMCALITAGIVVTTAAGLLLDGRFPIIVATPRTLHGLGMLLVYGPWQLKLFLGVMLLVLAALVVMCVIATAGVIVVVAMVAVALLLEGHMPAAVATPATLHGLGLVLVYGPWQSKLLLAVVVVERLCVAAVVFGTLSRMLRDTVRGAAFSERNVSRLHLIAAVYAVSLLSRFTLPLLAGPVLRHWLSSIGWSFNLSDLVLMLVCFALAEVFREGLRLREDVALTV